MNKLSQEALLVKAALAAKGLETPIIQNELNDSQKRTQIEQHMAGILTILGLDLSDDSLAQSAERIAKMYVNEIFSGLDYQTFPKITLIDNKMQFDEMVMVRDISFTSTCEHHFVTIDGFAHVAYIPRGKVIGLSKINRIVQFFAKRPQVQERLTQQVLLTLQTLLGTEDVAVSMRATHYCVKARGIKDCTSSTSTTSLGGVFKSQPATRAEFLAGTRGQ